MNIDSKTAAELARVAALSEDEVRFDLAADFKTEAGYAAFTERLLAKVRESVSAENRQALAQGFSVFASNPDNPAEVVEIAPDGHSFLAQRNAAGRRIRVRQLQ
jgi:hypothetical protein